MTLRELFNFVLDINILHFIWIIPVGLFLFVILVGIWAAIFD